jgi:N-acetylmuramoyl-L-alanine amidase
VSKGPVAWLDGIQQEPLSYQERLDERHPGDIDLIVIHATELPDMATARQYGEKIHYPVSQTGNSGHFYIDRDGEIQQWVALDRIAHHVAGYNAHSIGIELINLGRYPDWLDSRHQTWQEEVSSAQMGALIGLINQLKKSFPTLRHIAGHDQLDLRFIPASDDPGKTVRRKLDPGPDFPWDQVIDATGLSVFERP